MQCLNYSCYPNSDVIKSITLSKKDSTLLLIKFVFNFENADPETLVKAKKSYGKKY